jgi:hypothetical protein
MTETTVIDDGAEPTPEPSSQPATAGDVDTEAVRQRAYELSHANPDATAEGNWLRAEQELRERLEHERRLGEAGASETAAAFMARLEMDVFGHA